MAAVNNAAMNMGVQISVKQVKLILIYLTQYIQNVISTSNQYKNT
jgi:hypothetical protein